MTWQEHPEWKSEFASRGVSGAALVYDVQADRYLVLDGKRAQMASTFKAFHAMVALDTVR